MKNRAMLYLASATIAGLALGTALPAQAKDKPAIAYFLPRTNVAVSVAMTLASCPSETGEQPEIQSEWTVTAVGAADPSKLVKVDVSSGFLAKRSNAFEFYPSGTLAEFNGSSEGQGPALIGSILKTVANVVPLLAPRGASVLTETQDPIPANNRLYCSEGAIALLTALSAAKGEVRALEDKVVLGTATTADLDLLERRRKKRGALQDALTIEANANFAAQDENSNWIGHVVLPELLKDWFSTKPVDGNSIAFDRTKVKGIEGFGVTINPVETALAAKLAEGEAFDLNKVHRSLVYRRPVPAKVVVTVKGCTGSDCEAIELDGNPLIGQWGAISTLPVGNAGLFGSRQASASFDQFGTPLKLSYGSDSGAAGIGSTIEAAGSTAVAIADSEAAALEREVKKEELRQKLRDLRSGE